MRALALPALLLLMLLPLAQACTYPHAQSYPLRVVVRDAAGNLLLDADTGVREQSPACISSLREPPPFDGRFVGWRTPDGWRVHDTVGGQQRSFGREAVLAGIVAGRLAWLDDGNLRLEPATGGNATLLEPAGGWKVAGGMAIRFEYRDFSRPDSVTRVSVVDLATLESVVEGVPVAYKGVSDPPVASHEWLAFGRGEMQVARLPGMETTALNVTGRPLALVGDRLFFAANLGRPGSGTWEEVRSVLLPSGDGLRDDIDPRGIVGNRSALYVLDREHPVTTLDAGQGATASGAGHPDSSSSSSASAGTTAAASAALLAAVAAVAAAALVRRRLP